MKGTPENVRYLKGTKYHMLCDWRPYGLSRQVNLYYGQPSTDRASIKKTYFTEDVVSPEIRSFGPIGLRMEYYCPPFGIIPYSVMGLGIDYSYSKVQILYNSTIYNTGYFNDLTFNNHRLLLSANLMTLTRGDIIGYSSLQGGFDFIGRKRRSDDPSFSFRDLNHFHFFQYRIGQGIQYYIGNVYALVLEGGFGSGAYIRAGICFWF